MDQCHIQSTAFQCSTASTKISNRINYRNFCLYSKKSNGFNSCLGKKVSQTCFYKGLKVILACLFVTCKMDFTSKYQFDKKVYNV